MPFCRHRAAGMLFLLAAFAWSAGPRLHAEDWPRFRGPRGDGTSSDTSVPTQWSDSQNLKWKLDLQGAGFSSPIVVGKHVFVTAYSGARNRVQRHLVCVDRESGKAVWTKSVDGVSDGGDGGMAVHGQASHTPVSDGERVYVMFGSSGVIAFDLEGNQLWQQNVGNERRSMFGTGASPILHEDMVIVMAGSESQSIRAFDKKTGEERWKSEAAGYSSTFATPLIAANTQGVDELLISVTNELWSLNPKTGKLNWYAGTTVDTVACPSVIAHEGVAYVVGGRGNARRAAVRLDGEKDARDRVLWTDRGGSYVPSPVLYEGRLYWINDSGIATCVDAKTGEEVKRKRLGGKYYASPVLIDGKLYVVSRFGGTYVLKATPDFEQIAHNELSDTSDFSGSPAVSNGQLFIRSDKALYCIGE